MTQLDDLLGEDDPVNVPATSTEHANWRRKYAVALEQIDQSGAWELLKVLGAERKSTAPNALRLGAGQSPDAPGLKTRTH